MREKRSIDELTIEEIEKYLAIRKRQEREAKLKRMERSGRVVKTPPPPPIPAFPPEAALPPIAPPVPAQAPAPANGTPAANGAPPQFEDEPAGDLGYERPDKDRFWKSFVNQSLLLVEVLAVAGIVFLGYQMFTGIQKLQRESAAAQAEAEAQRKASIPTMIPTPQIQVDQVVLPGGHTSPTSSGGAHFNYDEIPANLLPIVQTQLLQPVVSRPPQTAETALEVSIPKLNMNSSPIIQGTDWEALKQGVGQLQNGVNPGDSNGNLVLSAHNDIYGELFRYLDKLEAGDEFTIRTQTKVYTYRVTGKSIHEPTDVAVLNPRGGPTATLISCYPYQVDNKRMVVFAVRVDTSL
jgi:sortase A